MIFDHNLGQPIENLGLWTHFLDNLLIVSSRLAAILHTGERAASTRPKIWIVENLGVRCLGSSIHR